MRKHLWVYILFNIFFLHLVYGDTIKLNGTLRDFNASHPDFEKYNDTGNWDFDGLDIGVIEYILGSDDKPVFIGSKKDEGYKSTTTKANFDQWYNDDATVNISMPYEIVLKKKDGAYVYDSLVDPIGDKIHPGFFPLDGKLFGNEGRIHNYHMTYEIKSRFTYNGGEEFEFSGDDDVWVFIDRKLVVDIGGLHSREEGSVKLDDLSLEKGKTYDFHMFWAERHTVDSNFKITTTIELGKTESNLEPFICDNTLFLSNANKLGVGAATSDMYLHSIDINVNPFSFPDIGDKHNQTYNALGYRFDSDGDYLYATYGKELLKIGKNGAIESLGDISGLGNYQNYAGTFDRDGYYYLADWERKNKIYKIDIESKEIIKTITMNKSILMWDMTIDKSGDFLFTVNIDNGIFTKIGISDGKIYEIGIPYDSKVDSIYSDKDGRVFIIVSGKGFYEIDIATGYRYFLSTVPLLTGLNDGANCNNATVLFEDLGDAPKSYGKAKAKIIQTLKLGEFVDHESDPTLYYSQDADADDLDGIDDEDSIDINDLNKLNIGSKSFSLDINLTNQTGEGARLKGWIDFDRDGRFDRDEMAQRIIQNGSTNVKLIWRNIPKDIKVGKSYLRLLLSNVTQSGEVEDYAFDIKPELQLLNAWDLGSDIEKKKIFTKRVNEDIILKVASLNHKAKGYACNGYKNIKVALYSTSSNLQLTAYKNVKLNNHHWKNINFGKVDKAYKSVFVKIRYEDRSGELKEIVASDKFAIRPDRYELEVSTNLVAGKEFSIVIKAVDVNGIKIGNYDEDLSVYGFDFNEIISSCTLGDLNITSKTNFSLGEAKIKAKYFDVGSLNLSSYEINSTNSEFALIDKGDGTSDALRFITRGSKVTSEFTVADVDIVNNLVSGGDHNFTYYSNNLAMSARLNTAVTALISGGGVARNFVSGCYAKDVGIVVDYVGNTNLTLPNLARGAGNITSFQYRIFAGEFINNGKANFTQRFNFNRALNVATNPMKITIDEINATVSGKSNIDTEDKTTIFLNARAYAPSQSAVGTEMIARVYYEAFVPNSMNRANFNLANRPESEDNINWYILPFDPVLNFTNAKLNFTDEVRLGSITSQTIEVISDNTPHGNRVEYRPDGYLLFHNFNSVSPTQSFQIRLFSKNNKWEGKGNTGKNIDRDQSAKGQQKMMW